MAHAWHRRRVRQKMLVSKNLLNISGVPDVVGKLSNCLAIKQKMSLCEGQYAETRAHIYGICFGYSQYRRNPPIALATQECPVVKLGKG